MQTGANLTYIRGAYFLTCIYFYGSNYIDIMLDQCYTVQYCFTRLIFSRWIRLKFYIILIINVKLYINLESFDMLLISTKIKGR